MDIIKNTEITSKANHMDMCIYEFCYAMLDSTWQCSDAMAGFARLYYVISGEGEIRYQNKVIRLLPGNIYLLPPFFSFAFSCQYQIEKFFCHLNLIFENGKNLLEGINECIVLENHTQDIFEAANLWKRDDIQSILAFKCLVYKNIMEAAGSKINTAITEYSETIKKAISIIHRQHTINLTLKEIADELFISASMLQKKFKKETGIPISQFITNSVLSSAERYLMSTNMSIGQISDIFGFCDPFYFSRVFSAHYGVSPKKYRQKNIT